MNRTITAQELRVLIDKAEPITLIDVRRKADYDADPQMIPNAVWRDPERVNQWSRDLPQDEEVVIYCVHGRSVSNSVVDHLQLKNIKARYIEGGIAAWNQIGGPVASKNDRR